MASENSLKALAVMVANTVFTIDTFWAKKKRRRSREEEEEEDDLQRKTMQIVKQKRPLVTTRSIYLQKESVSRGCVVVTHLRGTDGTEFESVTTVREGWGTVTILGGNLFDNKEEMGW